MTFAKNSLPSNRNFGITIGSVLLIICYFFYSLQLLLISLFFICFGIFNSQILKYPNQAWHRFGIYISKIFNPLILGIIYFLLFIPIGILLKIFKKDILDITINKSYKTFWKENNKTNYNEMRDQF